MDDVEGRAVLGLSVRIHEIDVGRIADVLVGEDGVPLGFEVLCGDGARRFLPAGAVKIGDDGIHLSTPLALLDDEDAEFYRRHGRSTVDS